MVTICTTEFNIQQFYVLPTQCIMCFVWIWEQTAIFPYTAALTDFLWLRRSVFTVRYGLNVKNLDYFLVYKRLMANFSRSQWPRGPRRGSAAALLLRLWVRILPGVSSVVCCQLEVSASGWSLVQRSPTECGVSECNREAPSGEAMTRKWGEAPQETRNGELQWQGHFC